MNLRVTCVQSDIIGREPEANRAHFDELLCDVKDTDLIVLPETFTTGFPADPNVYAESLDGPTMQWLRSKAKEKDAIVCGTFILKTDDFHNSFVWMLPDGTYHIYNKRHLFTMAGEVGLREGSECITIEWRGWRIRPFVCYDLRFPIWNRNRLVDGRFEYDLAVYSAEWPRSKAYIWDTLLKARAIENQAYTVGVNRIGTDDNDIPYIGGSIVVSMKGREMAKAEDEKESVFTTELNMEELKAFREYFTVSKDWDDFRP